MLNLDDYSNSSIETPKYSAKIFNLSTFGELRPVFQSDKVDVGMPVSLATLYADTSFFFNNSSKTLYNVFTSFLKSLDTITEM